MFPERFINVGIAEQNLMGTAADLLRRERFPLSVPLRCLPHAGLLSKSEITIAYPSLNVKIAATLAGITVGEDGASHQTVEDIFFDEIDT